jgi:hypothetical protein
VIFAWNQIHELRLSASKRELGFVEIELEPAVLDKVLGFEHDLAVLGKILELIVLERLQEMEIEPSVCHAQLIWKPGIIRDSDPMKVESATACSKNHFRK